MTEEDLQRLERKICTWTACGCNNIARAIAQGLRDAHKRIAELECELETGEER